MPKIKTSKTRNLIFKDGKWQFKIEKTTKEYDRYEGRFVKKDEKITYHELEEFGVVKELVFYIVFKDIMEGVWRSEGGVPTRYILKKFTARVPNLERFKDVYLKRAEDHRIVKNKFPNEAQLLYIHNADFVKQDKDFVKIFDNLELLKGYLKEYPEVEEKLYPDLYEEVSGGLRVVAHYHKRDKP